jgi:hypothetical protein
VKHIQNGEVSVHQDDLPTDKYMAAAQGRGRQFALEIHRNRIDVGAQAEGQNSVDHDLPLFFRAQPVSPTQARGQMIAVVDVPSVHDFVIVIIPASVVDMLNVIFVASMLHALSVLDMLDVLGMFHVLHVLSMFCVLDMLSVFLMLSMPGFVMVAVVISMVVVLAGYGEAGKSENHSQNAEPLAMSHNVLSFTQDESSFAERRAQNTVVLGPGARRSWAFGENGLRRVAADFFPFLPL